ncbi:hypothetical protein N802_03590 [Knoellia sinensis KCTC 19936]|uniref:Uncharacterized protein n=1 Tax=Knoellia sinensis KCTC 19936 TaxID=1385520 RepID=A0A0A0J429_9MICO|nr:hypothetical protein N802_03590 [Knoellia sinensis KCTC 19936]
MSVFVAVIAARFLVPLFIFRFPLPAIIAALILDGVDQTIFQTMGYDPPGYQGYDKAMDVFYLAIAYLAMLRNWTSMAAFAIGRALYFYRLVGVVAFEFSQERALLLIFPNTFEYFFIAYELIRLRWDPTRLSRSAWLAIAAGIWILVKLPQEYWIHIAQRDMTDELAAHAWLGPLLLVVVSVILYAVWRLLVPRLGPVAWPWRVVADPLPESVDEASERALWTAKYARVWSIPTLEKVLLVGLISVIFGQVLPGLRTTGTQLFIGIAAVVLANAAMTLAFARAGRSVEGAFAAFGTRVLINVSLVIVGGWLLGRGGGDSNQPATLFFILLLSLITTLHDRYWPVHAVRDHEDPPDTAVRRAGS